MEDEKIIARSLTESVLAVRQEKDLSEGSMGLRIRQVSVIHSDNPQEQLEEQIVSEILC
jgi:hypothetical protein